MYRLCQTQPFRMDETGVCKCKHYIPGLGGFTFLAAAFFFAASLTIQDTRLATQRYQFRCLLHSIRKVTIPYFVLALFRDLTVSVPMS